MSLYRQYENPYTLENQLEELKNEYCAAVERRADDEELISISESIAELKERINFAWQDDAEE